MLRECRPPPNAKAKQISEDINEWQMCISFLFDQNKIVQNNSEVDSPWVFDHIWKLEELYFWLLSPIFILVERRQTWAVIITVAATVLMLILWLFALMPGDMKATKQRINLYLFMLN